MEDQVSAPENNAPEVNYEQEASAQGWVPKEQFRGSESDWVDAETFVRRGKEIMPILRKNNEKLLKELNEAKKAAEEARQAAREFKEFQKQQFERKAQELESQLEQLKQAKKDAISLGEGERVVAIDDAIDALKEERTAAKQEFKKAEEASKASEQPQTPAVDPALTTWMEKNEWFGQDKRLTAIANGIGAQLSQENPGLVGKAFLEKLDEELATVMPEKFGKKSTPNPMEGAPSNINRPASFRGKKTYENLPPEAKAACDRFVKQKLMTRDQYLSEYDWS